MKRDNRGLTLMELVVTIAIIGIFAGVVTSVITMGTNTFRGTSGNATAQMEAQEALDQIQNLVIDANRGVYYCTSSDGTAMGTPISQDMGSDAADSKAFLTSRADASDDSYTWDVVWWDAGGEKLYYTKRSYPLSSAPAGGTTEASEGGSGGAGTYAALPGGSGGAGTYTALSGGGSGEVLRVSASDFEAPDDETVVLDVEEAADVDFLMGEAAPGADYSAGEGTALVDKKLLAENVTAFCADTSRVESEQIVRFEVGVTKKGKEVRVENSVALRNKVQVTPPGSAFTSDEEEQKEENQKASISITNVPGGALNPGDSHTFKAYLTGNVDPTTVTWHIKDEGTPNSASFPTSGASTFGPLKVSDSANGGFVVIYITAQTKDGKELISESVTVNISEIDTAGWELTTDQSREITLGAGTSYNLGNYYSGEMGWKFKKGTEEKPAVNVTYNAGADATDVTVDSSGQVTIPADAGNPGGLTSFTVNVSFQDPDNNTVQATVKVLVARMEITAPKGDYETEDVRPEVQFLYYVGGVSQDSSAIRVTTVQRPGTGDGYPRNGGGTFEDGDVGVWKLQAEVKPENCPVKLTDETTFEVKRKPPEVVPESATILLNYGKKEMILPNATYELDPKGDNKYHFYVNLGAFNLNEEYYHADYVGGEPYFHWPYGLMNAKWSIVGQSSLGTYIKDNMQVVVGADEKGFRLLCDFDVVKWDKYEVVYHYQAVRNVEVITHFEQRMGYNHQLIHGKEYDVKAVAIGSRLNPNGSGYIVEEHPVTVIGLDVNKADGTAWYDGDWYEGQPGIPKWTVKGKYTDIDVGTEIKVKLQIGAKDGDKIEGSYNNQTFEEIYTVVDQYEGDFVSASSVMPAEDQTQGEAG